MLTTFTVSAEVSQQISTGFNNQSNTTMNSGLGKGEGVWVLITLIFSFVLNYLIRKGEKKPDHNTKEQNTPLVPKNNPVAQMERLSGSKTKLAGKWDYANSRMHFRRKHFLQNVEAISLLNGIHNKQKIAS
jgi:hypothetical protein